MCYLKTGVRPISGSYISKYNTKRDKQINLMLIGEEKKSHFVCIKSMSRLMHGSHHETEQYCMNCLQSFYNDVKRDEHYNVCINNDFCRVKLPEMADFKDNRWITYEDLGKEVRVPFTIYADFKPVKELYKDKMNQMREQRRDGSYTEEVNRHVPSGFCFYIKFAHGNHPRALQRYTGEGCVERFVDILKYETERILDWPQKRI